MAKTSAEYVKELGEETVVKILGGFLEKAEKKKEKKAEEAALMEEFKAYKAAKAKRAGK